MICAGKSLLALAAGRAARSGLWLTGFLLKPHLLLLIVPALALQRQWRALATLGLGAAAVIGGSWLLAGSEAMSALARLWLGYSAGLSTSDIQLMMNWRMLSLHVTSLLGHGAGQSILIAGSVITSALALGMAVRRTGNDQARLAILAVGIWAATATVAWHSHVHSAVILIPPLLMLAFHRRDVGPRILSIWVLIPAAAFVVRVGLAALARLSVLPANAYSWIDSLGAVAQFGVNIWLLIVAARLARAAPAPHSSMDVSAAN